MLAPKLLVEFAKLDEQQAACAPFQALDKFADRQIRGYRHQPMDVACCHVTTFDDNIQRRTCLSDEFPQAFGNFTAQHGLTVFRAPHQMALEALHGMRCFSVTHVPIVLVTVPREPTGWLKTACLKAGVSTLSTDNEGGDMRFWSKRMSQSAPTGGADVREDAKITPKQRPS